MTIYEALRGINAYPIPARTLQEVCAKRGLDGESTANATTYRQPSWHLCCADLFLWLSNAPNVSQGGQSYSFTDEQRADLRSRASALLDEYGNGEAKPTRYGYKGSRL